MSNDKINELSTLDSLSDYELESISGGGFGLDSLDSINEWINEGSTIEKVGKFFLSTPAVIVLAPIAVAEKLSED